MEQMTDSFDEPIKEKQISRRSAACGLVWPCQGYPYYTCLVRENQRDESRTMETIGPVLQIFEEGPAKSMSELTDKLEELPRHKCRNIYCELDTKYYSYIRDFNKWKRASGSNVRLRATMASSFEAAILKIKTYVVANTLVFPENSLIRSQLSIFTKLSLKVPEEFYAVLSLCHAISFFDKHAQIDEMDVETTEVPSLKAWY